MCNGPLNPFLGSRPLFNKDPVFRPNRAAPLSFTDVSVRVGRSKQNVQSSKGPGKIPRIHMEHLIG